MLFKKKVLSSSVALALAGSTMPAFAQDEGLEIEEVIVGWYPCQSSKINGH